MREVATKAISHKLLVHVLCSSELEDDLVDILGQTEYVAAPLWIFYQFPQYIAIGASEVFTAVASLEFAYLAAPQSAHSLIMSLRFCSAGISAFIASIYVTVFDELQENFIFNNDQVNDPFRIEISCNIFDISSVKFQDVPICFIITSLFLRDYNSSLLSYFLCVRKNFNCLNFRKEN